MTGNFWWVIFEIFFFSSSSLMVYFKTCELKSSHSREGAVKGFSVCHTRHRLSILFLYEKKKRLPPPPGNLSVNYISSLLFTDETTFSVSWRFINTFTALKTLSGSIQTQLLCMLFLDTVPNNFFSRMYKNTSHPEFKSRKHSRLVKSGSQGIFISTIFVTSVTLNKVDIFLCVCSELATADS